MATMTTSKVLASVLSTAHTSKAATQTFPEAASPGDCVRQGDLFFTLLKEVPVNAVKDVSPEVQLAPGTTQGSRHCLQSLEGVTKYKVSDATALDGPILDVEEATEITHPEHGHRILPPGVYGVTYQRVHAEEVRRRQD